MNISPTSKKLVAGALLCGSLGLAGLGTGAGIAQANGGPYTWCPGQSMDDPSGPNRFGNQYDWDMSVCHTWYRVSYGYGNVFKLVDGQRTLQGSSAWEGDNPPGDNPSGVNCGLFFCPVPPHPDPNFHG
jgi:hypothetical protein